MVMGRPPREFTPEEREMVIKMAKVGIPQEDIGRVLGCDDETLRKHCREELDTAAIKANAEIGGTLYKKAMDGDTAAAIWWTKARMRWSEKTEQKIDGKMEVSWEEKVVGSSE